MQFRLLLLLLLAMILFTTCNKEDDSWSPSYEMDFLELVTSSDNTAKMAITDWGDTLGINNPIKNLDPDTTYRFIAVFTRNAQKIRLSSAAQVVSPNPSPFNGYSILTDSVKVQSIWRGGNYINLNLSIFAMEKRHIFGFVDRGITTNSEGNKTAHILLYHDKNDDTEAYSRTVYLSVPLYKYASILKHNRDSISFTVNQRTKGFTTFRFTY